MLVTKVNPIQMLPSSSKLCYSEDEENLSDDDQDIFNRGGIRYEKFGYEVIGSTALKAKQRKSLRLSKCHSSKKTINQDNSKESDSEGSLYSDVSCNSSSSSVTSKSAKSTWSNVNNILCDTNTWIMYLKDFYQDGVSYRDSKLVILWDFPIDFFRLTIREVRVIDKSMFDLTRQSSVTFLPRCNNGQFYIAQGLRKAPHFTLTSRASKMLKKILSSWSIPFANSAMPSSTNLSKHCQLFFTSIDNTNIFLESVAFKVKEMMLSIAMSGLMDWFASSKTTQQRARYTLSLGITSNKCHCY